MNLIKDLLTDALNGFVLADLPFLAFRLFVAGAIGWAMAWFLSKKEPGSKQAGIFSAIGMFGALVAICAEFALPLAILFAPVLLLLMPIVKGKSTLFNVVFALVAGCGLACGAGYIFIVLLALVFIVPVLWFVQSDS